MMQLAHCGHVRMQSADLLEQRIEIYMLILRND